MHDPLVDLTRNQPATWALTYWRATGDLLTAWETFKVYDGQIHAVEAFMRILPVEKRNGGWE